VPRLQARSFATPDDVRTMPKVRVATVGFDDATVSRSRFDPGWRWSTDMGPMIVATSCPIHHLGALRPAESVTVRYFTAKVLSVPDPNSEMRQRLYLKASGTVCCICTVRDTSLTARPRLTARAETARPTIVIERRCGGLRLSSRTRHESLGAKRPTARGMMWSRGVSKEPSWT